VVIALAGLSVVGIPMLTKMGLAAAGAVAVAVLISLTLVPALLGWWPSAVLSRTARRNGRIEVAGEHNGGTRWARFVLRRPVPVLLLSVVGLGALAVPVLDLQPGMPGDEVRPASTTERRAYDALAEGFDPGSNGPLTIVVDARGASDPEGAVTTVADRIGAEQGVVSVSPARFNETGDTAVFSATPATGPSDRKTQGLGHSNEEIAGKLYVSPLTVRTHVHRAMTRLGARDRAQLVVMAYQSGLVRAVPPAADR